MSDGEVVRRQRWMARGVSTFVVLSVDEDFKAWQAQQGEAVRERVKDALRAMLELSTIENSAPWATAEGRAHIRRQLERMSQLLEAEGVNDEIRGMAREIVKSMSPGADEWFRNSLQQEE